MNRKWLISVMSILMLAAVYIASIIVLPKAQTTNDTEKGNVSKNEFANVKNQESNIDVNLADRCVVVDSGHGGIDPGKESSDGVLEKDINLSIAQKLKSKLEDAQITVVMTRTEDAGLYEESDSNKKIADMKKRCNIINESQADLVVSIHQNSFQSGLVKGAQVFYYKYSAEGKKIAEILQASLIETLNPDNKRVAKADNTYYLLLHTQAPIVIAECGFLSNEEEKNLLQTDEYQQKVADALYNGIVTYLTEQ